MLPSSLIWYTKVTFHTTAMLLLGPSPLRSRSRSRRPCRNSSHIPCPTSSRRCPRFLLATTYPRHGRLLQVPAPILLQHLLVCSLHLQSTLLLLMLQCMLLSLSSSIICLAPELTTLQLQQLEHRCMATSGNQAMGLLLNLIFLQTNYLRI